MKILLVRAPYTPLADTRDYESGERHFMEPLALEMISAVVKSDHDVELIDMELEPGLEDKLAFFSPDLVAVSCHCPAGVYDAQAVLKRVKDYNPDLFTMVGGTGPSNLPEEFNDDSVDVIVVREGEITFRELVKAVEQKRDYRSIPGIGYREDGNLVFTKRRPFVQNLDELPLPDRSICRRYFDKYSHFIYGTPAQILYTTKGCDSRCNYCSVWKDFGGTIRYQSAERVIQEIENTEALNIDIMDDNFLQNIDRAKRIAHLIKERNINKESYFFFARCDTIAQHPEIIATWRDSAKKLFVFIGMEAIDNRFLQKFGKTTEQRHNEEAIRILNEHGVHFVCSLMVDPDFDRDDFKRVEDWVSERDIPFPSFLVYTPAPGASYFQKRYNDLTTHDWRKFEGYHAVVPTKLPEEEFYRRFDALWDIARNRAIHFITSEMEIREADLHFLEHFVEEHLKKKEELQSL